MLLVDLDAPYEYGWSGMGSSFAFQLEHDRLDRPMDLVTNERTVIQHLQQVSQG
jgi:hypothetical protein